MDESEYIDRAREHIGRRNQSSGPAGLDGLDPGEPPAGRFDEVVPAEAYGEQTPGADAINDVWPRLIEDDELPVTACGDVANAQRIHRYFGRDILFISGLGWHSWCQTHWQHDEHVVRRISLRLGIVVAQEAAAIQSRAAEMDLEGKRFLPPVDGEAEAVGKARELQEMADAIRSWAVATEKNAERIARALKTSQAYLHIPVERADGDHFLLPAVNGTLDLRTCELRPHRRTDFCTTALPVIYDPDAVAPLWLAFLDRIFAGNRELVAYLRRVVGYWLTGSVAEHAIFFFFGSGSNGKSTILEVFHRLLGQYMKPAAPGLLMAALGERHPTELADLRGVRVVSSIETAEGKTLDEERVKWLTGGDTLKGRRRFLCCTQVSALKLLLTRAFSTVLASPKWNCGAIPKNVSQPLSLWDFRRLRTAPKKEFRFMQPFLAFRFPTRGIDDLSGLPE